MSFTAEAQEAWDAMLDVMKEGNLDSCVMRYPVTRAGADKTGADDYDCLPSPTPDRLELMAGGFLQDYVFSLSARRDDFTTLPIVGELFSIKGKVSRILSVENTELAPIFVFHCGTPDK